MQALNHRPSWLTRLGVSLTVILAVGAGIVLSFVFFALFLAVAVVAGGWLWWQMRRLRRQMEEQYIEAEYEITPDEDIIEAEYELLEDRRDPRVIDLDKRRR